MSLKDKVCLVTGASRGIGKAIALMMGERGGIVIGTATSQKGADAISDYLKGAGITGQGMALNVNDDAQISEMMSAITEQYGAPNVLVNNAGITRDNLFLRMKDEEWQDIIDTNLTSVFKMSKACIKSMTKARFGRIINISSVVGVSGNPGQTNYCAAKAGVIGFSKSLAQEMASRNITVNAIAPGFIASDMTDELPEKTKESILASVPMGRLGSPEDIAASACFLASDDGGYITGSTLHVNGGMYMS